MSKKETDLTKTLKDLHTITEWFEDQESVDIEKGLEKVKEAAVLIKESRGRLKEVENEFREIEKEMETLD